MRDLAAVGQECSRTLKSEKIFNFDIWRTTQLRPKLEIVRNSQKQQKQPGHVCARAMAPRAALDPNPLKGVYTWAIPLGRTSYRRPAQLLAHHFNFFYLFPLVKMQNPDFRKNTLHRGKSPKKPEKKPDFGRKQLL